MRRGRWLSLVPTVVLLSSTFVAPAAADSLRCPDVTRAPMRAGYPMPADDGDDSGLVASPRYPGWGWMVRQHDRPVLYAVHFPGADAPHEVRPIRVLGATNIDWEDVVYQNGKLYVLESDQPWTRPDGPLTRVIYEIPEPDPVSASLVHPSARYRYAYPEGLRWNTEAMFSFAGHLVLVPKTTPARLYRFDQPLSAGRVNQPRLVGSLAGSDTVSLAAVSPDATTLVLANHEMLFAYRVPSAARYLWQFAARPAELRRLDHGDNVEAGGFFLTGQCKLVVVAKSRAIYRILDSP